MHYIYKIVNKITGKYYVGRTDDIGRRFEEHKSALKKRKHSSIYLQRSWNKYGEEKFEFVIYKDNLSLSESIEIEQDFLDNKRDEIYNLSYCSTGGDLISYHPMKEQIIKKRTETTILKRSKLSKDEKIELWGKPGELNPMFGKKHSEQSKIKIKNNISKFYVNNDGYRKNKTFEELFGEEKAKEMKNRLSEIASGRIGEKNPFFGRTHNKDTREKLRKAHLGKKPTNQRPVLINGIEYPSATEASRQLSVVPATILHRIKSNNPKYEQYFYKDTIQKMYS